MTDSTEIKLDYLEPGLVLYLNCHEGSQIFLDEDEHPQLVEGNFYDYEFSSKDYSFETNKAVSVNSRHKNLGVIAPNTFVGTLKLIINKQNGPHYQFHIEVRSVKIDYDSDYRIMLEDISKNCINLILRSNSLVNQLLDINFDEQADENILYQRFEFIKSVISDETFRDALQSIVSFPRVSWEQIEEETSLYRVHKITNQTVRDMCKKNGNEPVPSGNPLHKFGLRSIPRKVLSVTDRITNDTPENQFVKYALKNFLYFCQNVSRIASDNSPLKAEAVELTNYFENILHLDFFKSISDCTYVNLNNTALQNRYGYSEILQRWLQFDLAAKLTWSGGDNVYSAGKKDIALLYEYWVFFKLLEVVENVFEINPYNMNNLFDLSPTRLDVNLKKGSSLSIEGGYSGTRPFKMRFDYNRMFKGSQPYPNAGSWTLPMKPDYTLSIWPAEISMQTAEERESITHIHFDAKYRISNFYITELVSNIFDEADDVDFQLTSITKKAATFKKDDVFKMHAYKDAVRRTAGSYILYPGSVTKKMQAYYEVLPGLGAFALPPKENGQGTAEIEALIREVISNLEDRTSMREQISLTIYKVLNNTAVNKFVYRSLKIQQAKINH